MTSKIPAVFIWLSAALAALMLPVRDLRATDSAEVEAETDEAAKLAKQLSNPISSLISVPFQANEDFHMGPTNKGYQFKLNIQPVIPVSIGKDWNLIIRTILPVISQHDVFYRDIPTRFPGLPDKVLNEIPPALHEQAEKLASKLYRDAIRKHPQNRSQD